MASVKKPYIIGIAGGSASGKTHFLKALRECFDDQQVCIISQDNYYRAESEQKKDARGIINFDLPEGIDDQLFLDDINALLNNQVVYREEYTFNQQGVNGEIIELRPAPVIIVEGLFILHFPGIKNLLDLKIYLEASDEIKLQRRMERDKNERGLTEEIILYQWHQHVIPTYNRYLLPYRFETDIILTNNTGFNEGFELVRDHVEKVVMHPGFIGSGK